MPWLWRASWQGTVVIGVVLAAQWVFRKQLPARWRCGLWALVLVRLVLPVSFQTHLSVFNWVGGSGGWEQQSAVMAAAGGTAPGETVEEALRAEARRGEGGESTSSGPGSSARSMIKAASGWMSRVGGRVWLSGAIGVGGYLLVSALRFGRGVRRLRPVTDRVVLDLLEDCKQEMGVRTPLSVVETGCVSSPSLLGFIRPRLLLPMGLLGRFSLSELRYVFLHELAHVKRGDIALNWAASAALVLHWFNPLVWFALSRMRADRELACDALALSRAREAENQPYGQTIIKLLENFSRPALVPGVAGILENANEMKQRIRMIATFRRSSGWSVAAAGICGLLALGTLTDARSGQGAGRNGQGEPADPQGPPQIVSTSPKVGEENVSPELTEITVTFDRDMAGGFSWTGGTGDLPPSPEGKKPVWKDKRTCALPVKLQSGRYYRVGINSTSYQNFKSAEGVPSRPSAIYFTTVGASGALKRMSQKPMIVALEPKNGAQDVDPGLKEIRVTFNVPMGGGFSWTGGGPQFPTIPEGKKPFWSEDHKTCVLPVSLQSGSEYHMGLNSPSHKNFQSAGGVPLDPVSYTFKTR
jgi:beta-lactamase regulating signal transducer with metallopeptidase domain